jgi:hypothetical protein
LNLPPEPRQKAPVSTAPPNLALKTEIVVLTSGKSTQNALIFNPYKKLAKPSPKRLRLSCMSCKCMKFASKSAIESVSSANCASSASSGKPPLSEE